MIIKSNIVTEYFFRLNRKKSNASDAQILSKPDVIICIIREPFTKSPKPESAKSALSLSELLISCGLISKIMKTSKLSSVNTARTFRNLKVTWWNIQNESTWNKNVGFPDHSVVNFKISCKDFRFLMKTLPLDIFWWGTLIIHTRNWDAVNLYKKTLC